MTQRKISHRRKIIQGQGFQDFIVQHTNNGIQYLRMQSVNGVRRLVPYAFEAFENITNKGINQLIPILGPTVAQSLTNGNALATKGLSDIVKSNLVAKMGGQIRPNRNLIMREINHALRG